VNDVKLRTSTIPLLIALLTLFAPSAASAQDALDYAFVSDSEIVTAHGWTHTISYMMDYTVSGTVIGIAYYNEETTLFSPLDVAIAWGDMATPSLLEFLEVTMVDRRLSYQWRSVGGSPSQDYVTSHISNTHVIPRTPEIHEACMNLEVGDEVTLSGRLVDVDGTRREGGYIYHSHWGPSSTSLHDTGDGACEILVVENIGIAGTEQHEVVHERLPVVEQIRTHRAVHAAIAWRMDHDDAGTCPATFPSRSVIPGARLEQDTIRLPWM